MSNKPNPGSKEARKQGCLCPVVDNEFGKGYLGNGERFGFVSNEHCPLHGANSVGSNKAWNFIEQFKTAIKKYKHTQRYVAYHLKIVESSLSRILRGKQSDLATKLTKEIRIYINYGRFEEDEEIVPREALIQLGETMAKPTYTKDAVEFTTKEFIKQNWKGQVRNIGCLVAKLIQISDDPNYPYMVAIGVSFCNTRHDKFDKRIAEDIAIGRAMNHHKEYKLKDKQLYYDDSRGIVYLKDEVERFILRCMRYYKDKNIILPKIIFV